VKTGSFGKIERGRSTHKEKNEITLLLYKISIFVNNSKIYLAKDKSKNINIICQISNIDKKDEKRLLMELSILHPRKFKMPFSNILNLQGLAISDLCKLWLCGCIPRNTIGSNIPKSSFNFFARVNTPLIAEKTADRLIAFYVAA